MYRGTPTPLPAGLSAGGTRRAGRHAAAVGVLVLLIAGCSSSPYSVQGQLAQVTSEAAAQARTGALTLTATTRGQTLPSVDKVGLSDALAALANDDAVLTQTEVTGRLAQLRDQALVLVRQAEDLVVQGRSRISDGSTGRAVRSTAVQLRALAAKLSAVAKKIEGGG